MEKSSLTLRFELMIVVNTKLTTEEKESIFAEAVEVVGKGGGKVINSKVWLERQRFSFPIKKCAEGTYYLINFQGESSVVGKIRSVLRLKEKILRFMIVSEE